MPSVLLECGHAVSEAEEIDGEYHCRACAEPLLADAIEEPVLSEPGKAQDEGHAHYDAGEKPASGLAPQPFHSVRGTEPGARGCWATSKRTQKPCGAPNVRGEHYCSAHLGRGVAQDPSRYSPQGIEVRKRNSAIRSQVKLMYGSSRSGSARHVLGAAVEREAVPLVGRAVGAALSPETEPVKAAHLAVKLIESADPRDQEGQQRGPSVSG